MLLSPTTFRRKVSRCFNHIDTSGLHSCNKRRRASMAHAPTCYTPPSFSGFKPIGRDKLGMHGIFQQSQQRQLHSLSAADAAHSGLPCSALRTERVRCSLSAGSLCAHDRGARSPCTSYFAFWLNLFSIFSLLRFTVFIKSSLLLTIPSTLAPLRLMLADPSFPHRSDGGFSPWLHCQRAFDRLLPPCFTS